MSQNDMTVDRFRFISTLKLKKYATSGRLRLFYGRFSDAVSLYQYMYQILCRQLTKGCLVFLTQDTKMRSSMTLCSRKQQLMKQCVKDVSIESLKSALGLLCSRIVRQAHEFLNVHLIFESSRFNKQGRHFQKLPILQSRSWI